MAFNLTSGEDVREVSLRSGLRGYDKAEVDAFRDAVAKLVDDLRRRADLASGHLAQLGLEEPLDLKDEFQSVGREVSAILEAARTAATDIRRRAGADADRWREDAVGDASRMRSEAWEEGSAQLEASVDQARETRAAADEDILFIWAQAEKEAIRLTSETKRDAEEAVRAARAEAEAIIADARVVADAAQVRTRALELRREELMGELEEARDAIGVVEDKIEDQHQRLMSPESSTIRIIDIATDAPDHEPGAEHGGWLGGDKSVRIVAPQHSAEGSAPLAELEPVLDADDIVAEVERLQIDPGVEDPWSERWPVDTGTEAPDTDEHVVVEADDPEPATSAADETGSEPVVADDPPIETAVTPVVADRPAASDGLTGLFASLRTPSGESSSEDKPEGLATGIEPVARLLAKPRREASAIPEPDPEPDAFSDRERQLLPIVNRTLRVVKKQLLEFQNVMLEATKADPDGWRPAAEDYRLSLDPHIQAMIDETHQIVGAEGTSGVEVVFGAAFHDAIVSAVDTVEGSGFRETSATLGRVYRSWRGDEAERRLNLLANTAYDEAQSIRTSS